MDYGGGYWPILKFIIDTMHEMHIKIVDIHSFESVYSVGELDLGLPLMVVGREKIFGCVNDCSKYQSKHNECACLVQDREGIRRTVHPCDLAVMAAE